MSAPLPPAASGAAADHHADGRLVSAGCTVRLPGVLDQMHRLLGLPLTLRIIDAYGGGMLHIPAALTAEHPLAHLLGFDAAARLAAALGSCRYCPIEVPTGAGELTFHFARTFRVQGHAIAEIRRLLLDRYRLRVTERRIRQLVGDIKLGNRRPVPEPTSRSQPCFADAQMQAA